MVCVVARNMFMMKLFLQLYYFILLFAIVNYLR